MAKNNSISKVLIVGAEVSPYASVGGQARVLAYLSKALRELGVDARVFMPKFGFIDKKEYSQFIKEAEGFSPDKNDSEFFALCLKHSCFLWSNDLALKNQENVKVLSTEEFIDFMF